MRALALLLVASTAFAAPAEILHGTGLQWGMSEAQVEHVLHARITQNTQFGKYYIPAGTYQGLPASYMLNFTKGGLSQVSVHIPRPDSGARQADFDGLAARFKQWYGKPASPLSVESAAVTSLVWATPEAKVAFQNGVEQTTGKQTAVISATKRVMPEDAVTVDSKTLVALQAGRSLMIGWAGTPVLVVRRAQQDIDQLAAHPADTPDSGDGSLFIVLASLERPLSLDEPFVHTPYRSIRPDIGVYIGVSTRSACTLAYEDLSALSAAPGMGFYDPCNGHASWDSAGRPQVQGFNVTPLAIPKYHFEPDGDLVIGR